MVLFFSGVLIAGLIAIMLQEWKYTYIPSLFRSHNCRGDFTSAGGVEKAKIIT